MNYLVHLYLSDPEPDVQLGNLLGDWVKGRLDPEAWPAGILRGLKQHRTIDRISQTSPAVRQSKARIDDRFGILKPVMVDIFYDHLLAANWSDFNNQPLDEFSAQIYRLFDRYHQLLPDAFRPVGERMAQMDWLVSYQEEKTVSIVLQRMSLRLKRENILGEGADELFLDLDGFHDDMVLFLTTGRDSLT